MLTLLVPILINYLVEGEELQRATKYQASLHQQSFQWLNKIGPKYPQVSYCVKEIVFQVVNCTPPIMRDNRYSHLLGI